jgi:hypothetical protein
MSRKSSPPPDRLSDKDEHMKQWGELSRKEQSDMRTLLRFGAIFCREHHGSGPAPFAFRGVTAKQMGVEGALLCPDCTRLMRYALAMRLKCPYDPKPMCKKCTDHCYRGKYRERIREIMRFSGLYLVKHGRLDLLYHYFR